MPFAVNLTVTFLLCPAATEKLFEPIRTRFPFTRARRTIFPVRIISRVVSDTKPVHGAPPQLIVNVTPPGPALSSEPTDSKPIVGVPPCWLGGVGNCGVTRWVCWLPWPDV